MTYDPNVPLSTQSLNDTRDKIKTNFATLQTVINVNHVDIDATGQGKHKFIQIPSGSAPTTNANECALYTSGTGSQTYLFLRQQSDGTSLQLSGANYFIQPTGYTFLPGNMVFIWGSQAATGGTFSVTYPNGLTLGIVTFAAICNSDVKDINFYVNAVTTTGFSGVKNSGNCNFRWTAIGKAQ